MPSCSGAHWVAPALPSDAGTLAPLRHRVFRVLWLATIIGNIGTWIRDVGSGWAMTELSTSPLMVALVQAFGSLPMFALALPAGVLADLLDRRRVLLFAQVWLMLASLALTVLAAADSLTALSLLLLTLAGGVGAALMAPAWQAIVPELVPRAQLRPAVALNSLGINIARATGPALGGLVLATWGLAAAYGLDLLSYAVTAAALLWWRRERQTRQDTPEHLLGALRAGLRYARASTELRHTLLRATGFFLFTSAAWALMPLIARAVPGSSPRLYGSMLAAIGVGAVAGALALPHLRVRMSGDALLRLATVLLSIALLGYAGFRGTTASIGFSLVCGVGWILALTILAATVQAVLPDWVRGRGLALYLTVFYGSMSVGSMLWGVLAGTHGLHMALGMAAMGVLLAMGLLWRITVPSGEADVSPARSWPDPVVAWPPVDGRGPVRVLIEYRIDPARQDEFLQLLRIMSAERRRNGAYAWRAYSDVADPASVVETFDEYSWAEHQRHHARVTRADADLQARLQAFHLGPDPPRVRHLLA